MAQIYVINKFQGNPYPNAIEVDTTSGGPFKDLSPFYLGPIVDPHTGENCLNFENYWQYSKVYLDQWDFDKPTPGYWEWRKQGFNNNRAIRYPKGKGAKPFGSLFGNEILDYITARKRIYAPFYAGLVACTYSYTLLYKWLIIDNRDVVLRDYDGYDYTSLNMSLIEVINNPKRKMGHAFILAGMLTGMFEGMIKE